MLEEKQEIVIDTFNVTNKSISIVKYNVVYKDGIELSRVHLDRCAFVPGDIEKVKAYLNMQDEPEIQYLESIWTDEVIQRNKAAQEAAIKI